MPLAPPVISATRPGELAARRRLRELVALERPVLDRERLGLAQRAEAARRASAASCDRDRALVEVARDPRPAGVGAARDDADARHEHDARPGRVDRERPRLVVEVALVVARGTRPRTPSTPCAQRRRELVGARRVAGSKSTTSGRCFVLIRWSGHGRADLAHLGRARGRRERHRLGAAVDLEHRRRPRRRAARRGAPAALWARSAVGRRLAELGATFGPPSPKPAATLPASSASAARVTNSIVARVALLAASRPR